MIDRRPISGFLPKHGFDFENLSETRLIF